jgi:hypothetical protein
LHHVVVVDQRQDMNMICGGGGAISWNVQSIAICNSVMEQSLLFFEIPSKLIALMLFVFEVTTVLNSFLGFTIALVCTKLLMMLFLAKDRI